MQKTELIATRVSPKQKELFKEISSQFKLTESSLLRMLLSYLLEYDAERLKEVVTKIVNEKKKSK